MTRPRRPWTSGMLLTLAVLATGCGKGLESGAFNGSEHGSGKSSSYGITWLSWQGRPVLLVFNQGLVGPGSIDHSGFHAKLVMDDARRIGDEQSLDFVCSTQDGKHGEVSIAGQKFDLSQGNVFLISASRSSDHVRQLTVDLAPLTEPLVHDEQLRSLQFLDPEIEATILKWHGEERKDK